MHLQLWLLRHDVISFLTPFGTPFTVGKVGRRGIEKMVTTRGMSATEAKLPLSSGDSVDERKPGSMLWFKSEVGLNAVGFVLGTDLEKDVCSKQEYEAFWGPKDYNNGTRYKRNVSPRMLRRIRHLYQRVFQRPIGAADALPYHFGRGQLAERNGYPINWAAYARKMTHRGTGDTVHLGGTSRQPQKLTKFGKPFEFVSMEDLRKKTPAGMWPKYEAAEKSDGEEGRDDDWEVNVHFHVDDINLANFRPATTNAMPPTPLRRFVSLREKTPTGMYFTGRRPCVMDCY